MSIILRPATNLMNKLTYLQKFILISLICLVPLLTLAYMQLNTLHKAKLVTEKELNGLIELRHTLSLVSLSAERRDLMLVRGMSLVLTKALENVFNKTKLTIFNCSTLLKKRLKVMNTQAPYR
ncbi:hypothetical protein L3081_02300 [Colwellia sp. MSW7]|uniref:Uncharacterized protein n=1 Tax=Colwellia maritima TaxID=2912588 RepID=A0ABS9WWX1_9GAMM|nr:hypothetical protein [Colwellia maritima]MCI2282439.1 hypothetical protein [Colwellia maritima]